MSEQFELHDVPGQFEREAATTMLDRAAERLGDLDAAGADPVGPAMLEAQQAYREALRMRDGALEAIHHLRGASAEQAAAAFRRARAVARQRSADLRVVECDDEAAEVELEEAARLSIEADLDVAGLERITDRIQVQRIAEKERGREL